MAKTQQIDVNIWQKEGLWRYRIVSRTPTFDPKVTDDKPVAERFSDDFDELLGEALAEARTHAEVLRHG